MVTPNFQLFKNGVSLKRMHLDSPAIKHQFLLTGDTKGLYRCRSGLSRGWTKLSNLLELTWPKSFPPPLLSAEPVSWITPGLDTNLVCLGGLPGMTFILRREGDGKFLQVAEAREDVKATFPVQQAGNYSCSYRIHTAGAPSGPSATVIIKELAVPPPPKLNVPSEAAGVLHPGQPASLLCVAPRSGVTFQLRQGDRVRWVPMSSTTPGRAFIHLGALAPGDSGEYTCRYRPGGEPDVWSEDSVPAELTLSDGPTWATSSPPARSPLAAQVCVGAVTRLLRATGLRPLLRLRAQSSDAGGRRVHRLQSPAGTEADFELRDVSVADSANYSCVYVDLLPPFAGSAPSAPWELRVDGPPPRPQLRPLWSGAVTPGRDAVLRCEGPIADVNFELLRAGDTEPLAELMSLGSSAELVLVYVGPQHAGNYSCRYRSSWPIPLESELSAPVELRVAGDTFWAVGCSASWPPGLPSTAPSSRPTSPALHLGSVGGLVSRKADPAAEKVLMASSGRPGTLKFPPPPPTPPPVELEAPSLGRGLPPFFQKLINRKRDFFKNVCLTSVSEAPRVQGWTPRAGWARILGPESHGHWVDAEGGGIQNRL
ncbi:alpha-1B-glycoprotein-like [Carlito syrichta]|uniref:Alpha-1B-glycoprotein-like n=1 Tax=Carlito syrichta TaxID=1868482 RepID=A0A3Q0EK70_CARSF|nr:alpha-1B-glycoprotein-like [Carlito syrichta]